MTATLFLTVSKERIEIHYFYAIAWAWALEPGVSIGYYLTT
ncbi:hypothetical protein COO91_09606 (plasmid) [Nostoc flagelliforme CCNUN1]|uniref:Uncharacterized protein n=1 Tax=Nostoc flagelliforme CCNUN1 TaxID=2038116 RepID=A0A2K8T702_9NOSO|nr:hypothetical protein COO91_09606 [Nostoc flagelliforme CCNUN1]